MRTPAPVVAHEAFGDIQLTCFQHLSPVYVGSANDHPDHAVIVIVTAGVVAGASFAVWRNGEPTPESAVAQLIRSADGRPDFSGIWQTNSTANWDLQTHEAHPMVAQAGVYPDVPVLAAPVVALGTAGWVPPGLGVVEGDEIPYQPWAARRK